MILPFSKERKAIWTLKDNLEEINHVIAENDVVHFRLAITDLYPKLQQYDVNMPEVDEVWDDSEWHRNFLKFLRREIRNGTFNLKRWNFTIQRNELGRREMTAIQKQAPPGEAEQGKLE